MHWIQGAVKRKGALTEKAKRAGMSVAAFARKHQHDTGPRGSASLRTGQEARFYERLHEMRLKSAAGRRAAEEGARTEKRHARLPRTAAGK